MTARPYRQQEQWDQYDIVAVLRLAHRDIQEPLTLPRLNEWSEETGIPVPSPRTITNHFGSWAEACDTAGVPRLSLDGPRPSGPAPVDSRTCWAALREYLRVCEQRGLRPTLERYEIMAREKRWPARNTLTLRLGMTFREALAEAPRHRVQSEATTAPHPRRESNRPATAKAVVAALVEAWGAGDKKLTTIAYRQWAAGQENAPSIDVIRSRFGTWVAACKAAGVVPLRRPWSEKAIISALRKAYENVDGPFTGYRYRDWVATQPDALTYPSTDAVVRAFGSWAQACEAARVPTGSRISDAQILAALRAAQRATKGRLTSTAYSAWRVAQRRKGKVAPTADTVYRRFGGWRHAMDALDHEMA